MGQVDGEALKGKGNIAYLGGPPGTSESLEKAEGLKEAFAGTDMKWIGQHPFEVTNWDPSKMATVMSALIAKYPTDRRHFRRPLWLRC